MITIAALRQELEDSRGLGDIIEVLKTGAIIQFHSFQTKEKPNIEFLRTIESSFYKMLDLGVKHPYLYDARPDLPSAILVVTSNEGFLGELNTLLINAGLDQRKSKDDELIVLGERGAKYLEDMNLSFKTFPGLTEEIKGKDVEGIRNYLLNNYLKRFGRIFIVYAEFVSLTVQRIEVFPMLPFSAFDKKEAPLGSFHEELLLEPSPQKALGLLVELWAAFKLLEIFWSSKLSEFSARIMHLEGSTQELSQLNQRLGLQYFREVHALRDRSIREISASKILLERK